MNKAILPGLSVSFLAGLITPKRNDSHKLKVAQIYNIGQKQLRYFSGVLVEKDLRQSGALYEADLLPLSCNPYCRTCPK